jgi:hypothetical protein
VSASTRRLPSTTIWDVDCAKARSIVAIVPIAAPKTIPPRTKPAKPSPRNSRNGNIMRNAPFWTLLTDGTALSREVADNMFVQAFPGTSTQLPKKPLHYPQETAGTPHSYDAAR